LPDANAGGFVGYSGGRCVDVDTAVAMGRTADSLVVICQNRDGHLYYVGFGLRNRLSIVVPGALPYYSGYVANNIDTQYTVTSDALTIYQTASGNDVEPMIEYWRN
jgi:hypothetical protein